MPFVLLLSENEAEVRLIAVIVAVTREFSLFSTLIIKFFLLFAWALASLKLALSSPLLEPLPLRIKITLSCRR